MHSPASIISAEISFANFDLASFGQVNVPAQPLRFGFQVDIVPSMIEASHLLFGLVGRVRDLDGQGRSLGFAVRLDLETGEIWDMVNDSGLIGWMESRGSFSQFTDEEPMLLSWEVDNVGSALIPRLQIAGEEWLYPAVHRHEPMVLDTIAGVMGPKGVSLKTFMHPAVWRESL